MRHHGHVDIAPSPIVDASAWQQALYAFLAEKERRSGSLRTVQSYSRMLAHFFGSPARRPDRVTSPEVLAWAHGIGLSGRKALGGHDRRPDRLPLELLPLPIRMGAARPRTPVTRWSGPKIGRVRRAASPATTCGACLRSSPTRSPAAGTAPSS